MIPVSTLYDEYIERRKFTEQKKNPVEYIVPPPSRGSEQKVGLVKQNCGMGQVILLKSWGRRCRINVLQLHAVLSAVVIFLNRAQERKQIRLERN